MGRENQLANAADLASQIIAEWHDGQTPATHEALRQYPELRHNKSIVMGLATEEYFVRRARGEKISPTEFCQKFPELKKSIRRMLNIQWEVDRIAQETSQASISSLKDGRTDTAAESTADAVHVPKVGAEFRGFKLVEKIGEGGIAQVFLAKDLSLNDRLVVLKFSPLGMDEAVLQGKLAHQNIVNVFFVRVDPVSKLSAIVMPYLGRSTFVDLIDLAFSKDGLPTSGDVIRQAAIRAYPDDERLAVASTLPQTDDLEAEDYIDGILKLSIQLADTLEFAHQKSVIHRDLKPSNILLTPTGIPMLLDFNLSVTADQVPNIVGGTLAYMSPELLDELISQRPKSERVADPRTDIFSLGCILYELLTGQLPFGDAEDAESILMSANQILIRQIEAPLRRQPENEHLDDDLFSIIAGCLHLNPEDRTAKAADLAQQLREYRNQRRAAKLETLFPSSLDLPKEPSPPTESLSPASHSSPQARKPQSVRHRFLETLTYLSSAAVVCVFAVAAVSAWNEGSVPYALREYRAGAVDYHQQKLTSALVHFSNAANADPSDPRFCFAKGQVYRKFKDYRDAEVEYRKADKLSDIGLIDACLGHCCSEIHDTKRHWYEEALASGYESAAVRAGLSSANSPAALIPQSYEHLRRAIELDPEYARSYEVRITLFLNEVAITGKTGNWEQAYKDAEKLIRLRSDNPRAYLSAAHVYARAAYVLNDPVKRELAIQCFGQVVDKGLTSLKQLGVLANPSFKELFDDPRVEETLLRADSIRQKNDSPASGVYKPEADYQLLDEVRSEKPLRKKLN